MVRYFRVRIHGIDGYEFHVQSTDEFIHPHSILEICENIGLFKNITDANFANVTEEPYNRNYYFYQID